MGNNKAMNKLNFYIISFFEKYTDYNADAHVDVIIELKYEKFETLYDQMNMIVTNGRYNIKNEFEVSYGKNYINVARWISPIIMWRPKKNNMQKPENLLRITENPEDTINSIVDMFDMMENDGQLLSFKGVDKKNIKFNGIILSENGDIIKKRNIEFYQIDIDEYLIEVICNISNNGTIYFIYSEKLKIFAFQMSIYNRGDRVYIGSDKFDSVHIVRKRVEYNIEKISLNRRLGNESSKDIICNTEILLKTFFDSNEINNNIKNINIDLPLKMICNSPIINASIICTEGIFIDKKTFNNPTNLINTI